MIDLANFQNSIVIGPSGSKISFLQARNANPSYHFRYYSPEEALAFFAYQSDYRALRYLISQGASYELANDELRAIQFLTKDHYLSAKLNHLLPLREALLKQGLLTLNSHTKALFSRQNIIFYNLAGAQPLSDRLGELPNMALSFQKEEKGPFPKEYLTFPDIYSEIHYVLNLIVEEMDNGASGDDIAIFGADENYFSLLEIGAKEYGLSINLPATKRLYDAPIYRAFRANYLKSKDPLASLTKIQEIYPNEGDLPTIFAFVQEFKGVKNSPEDELALYDEIAKSKKSKPLRYQGGITLCNDYSEASCHYVHLLNFAFGVYPSLSQDTDYLSDEEKKELSLYTSKDLNVQKRLSLDYLLTSSSIKSISFKETPDGKSLPSLLSSDKEHPMNKDSGVYVKMEHALDGGSLWENFLLEKREIGQDAIGLNSYLAKNKATYGTFNPSFSHFNVGVEGNLSLSASSLKTYYACPFEYYLSRYLRIQDEEKTFSTIIGSLFHEVLQKMYEPNFSFDKCFQASLEEQENKERPLTKQEMVFMPKLKDALLSAYEFYRKNEDPSQMALDSTPKTEYAFKLPLKPFSNVFLTGSIDKVVLTGSHYLSLVDYKTGNSGDFVEEELPYGLSIQLPLYAYVSTIDPNFQDKTLLGLFIGHVLFTQIFGKGTDTYDKNRNLFYKLDGFFTDDEKGLASLDINYKASSLIAGCRIKNDGSFYAKSRNRNQEQMEGYIKQAENLAINAAHKILKSEFPVEPKRFKGQFLSCTNCPYQDICYRDDNAIINLVPYDQDEETKGDNKHE